MTSRIWRYALLAMALTSLTGFSLIVAGGHSLSVLSDRVLSGSRSLASDSLEGALSLPGTWVA